MDESKVAVHDFTPGKLKWGWNILDYTHVGEEHADIMCVGENVKPGDKVILQHVYLQYQYSVEEIQYNDNPPDLFKARIYCERIVYPLN